MTTCRQGSFHRPASPSNAGMESGIADWRFIGPLREREGFAIMGNAYIAPSVILLLLSCSPFTVISKITQVIVDSLNGQTVRAFPHIGKEILKDHPFITNGNASFSILFVGFVIFISTSILHGTMNSICSYFVQAMSYAVSISKATASAGCGIARLKVGNLDSNLVAAVAPAKPMYFLSAISGKLALIANSYETIKSNVCYVGEIAHKRTLAHIKE